MWTSKILKRQVNRMDNCDSHGRSRCTEWKSRAVCEYLYDYYILF